MGWECEKSSLKLDQTTARMASNDNGNIAATTNAPSSYTSKQQPLTIGVFGGSFNPIHLGHALLAITVRQTKAVDDVVLVPVYKHAVKRDLLPFEDRVNMCRLAVPGATVSTIEQEVGESNGAMLRGLKTKYPAGTRFLWICGDDFFHWMDRPKGLETLQQVDGLIVQRRLHRSSTSTSTSSTGGTASADRSTFFKEPFDEAKVRRVADQMNLEVDFVFGELPHFSSTLVRRAPGHWRSFLTTAVAKYLDERPHLLKQLMDNLEADAANEEEQKKKKQKILHQRSPSVVQRYSAATSVILRGLEVAHALQFERGHTSMRLAIGDRHLKQLQQTQKSTDDLLQEIAKSQAANNELDNEFDEVQTLAAELQRVSVWLNMDRRVLEKRANALSQKPGADGWLARLALVEKFNPRIDVLVDCTIRALSEIFERHSDSVQQQHSDVPELLLKWCHGKESLGRLRAFVCAGGPNVAETLRKSLPLRERLNQTIDTKDRRIARVLEMDVSHRLSAPEALLKMLEEVTRCEYKLMGCFAASTPIPLVHRLLLVKDNGQQEKMFDVVDFFDASTSAIDFLLSFSKALAAAACASA